MRMTDSDYAKLATELAEPLRRDLLTLGRGAKARLLRDGQDLCIKRGGHLTLTSRAYALREELIRQSRRAA